MAEGSIDLTAPEAEESLLALCLESTTALLSVVGSGLKPEDFGASAHELLFRTMVTMQDAGKSVDAATLISHLEAGGKLDLVGGRGVIERLSTVAPVHGVNQYADILRDRRIRREYFDAFDAGARLLHSEPDIRKVATGIENQLYRVSDRMEGGAKSGMTANELVELFVMKKEEVDRIPFSYPTLNEHTKGRERGALSVVGAYSNDGKTIVGMQSALDAARAGYSVGFFSLEMTEEELLYRLLSMHTGIDMKRIEAEDYTMEEFGLIQRAIHQISQLPLKTYHDPEYTPTEISAIQKRERFDLIIVDYLQRFHYTDWQHIGQMAKQFKNMALSTKCCVDVLSQLTVKEYKPGQNPFPRPNLAMLFGGRVTSHEANNVIFLWPEREQVNGYWEKTGKGEIILAKSRSGSADLAFPVYLDKKRIMWLEPNDENVLYLPGANT